VLADNGLTVVPGAGRAELIPDPEIKETIDPDEGRLVNIVIMDVAAFVVAADWALALAGAAGVALEATATARGLAVDSCGGRVAGPSDLVSAGINTEGFLVC